MKNSIWLVSALILAAYVWVDFGSGRHLDVSSFNDESPEQSLTAAASTLDEAYRNHSSNVQVDGRGVVTRVLSDDNDGSRHQRFILELVTGQTLLVAHNIDLAPRITSIKPGDQVSFYGEYEWNSQGGVIHWTHRDPQGKHVAGWLKHEGKTYQ